MLDSCFGVRRLCLCRGLRLSNTKWPCAQGLGSGLDEEGVAAQAAKVAAAAEAEEEAASKKDMDRTARLMAAKREVGASEPPERPLAIA